MTQASDNSITLAPCMSITTSDSTWVWPLTKGGAAHTSGLSIIYTTSTLGAVTTPPMALALSIYGFTYLPSLYHHPIWATPLNLNNGWETALHGLYSYHISQLFSSAWAKRTPNRGQVWRPCLHSANFNPVYSLSECDVA